MKLDMKSRVCVPTPLCFMHRVLSRMGRLPAEPLVGRCLVFEKLVKVKLLSAPGQRATLMKGLFIILMGYTNLLTSMSTTALEKEKKSPHTRTPTATKHIHASAQVREIYSKNRTMVLEGNIKVEWWVWAAFGVCWFQGSGTIRIGDRE